MIVDAHHHFWDPSRRDYPWMGDELAAIRRPFGPNDLRPLLADNGVEKTILVQTVSSLEETREFLETAAAYEFVGGVVGWVDLTSPAVEEYLQAIYTLADENGHVAAVGDAGLVYDLLVRTRELPAALETVRRHRGTSFVIDHAAKPRIAGGSWDAGWEKALEPFGDKPNVACKLSGLVTEADWKSWTPEQLAPYVQRVLDWFGPERCMFGSDWPVCLLAADYARVMDSLQQIVGPDEWIFGNTARRVYRLADLEP